MQKGIKEILKRRLIDAVFSRKFIALLIACCAFFLTEKFDAQYLVMAIGIYCGTNTLEAVVYGVRKKQGNAPDA